MILHSSAQYVASPSIAASAPQATGCRQCMGSSKLSTFKGCEATHCLRASRVMKDCFYLLAGQDTPAPTAAAAPTAALLDAHDALLPSMAPEVEPTSTASLGCTLLQVGSCANTSLLLDMPSCEGCPLCCNYSRVACATGTHMSKTCPSASPPHHTPVRSPLLSSNNPSP